MTITFPARLTSIRAEADKLAPARRRSSDGMLGDAAHRAEVSDHNPDPVTGIVHAVDVSQSMPGTPYWEPQFGQFDVFAHFRRIVADYTAADATERRARWDWLHYLVWYEAALGYEVIFNPSLNLEVRQNGSRKVGHTEHGHISINHDARSENDTQPIFGSTPEDDDVTTEAQIEEIVDKVVGRLAVIDGGQASGLIPVMIKRYIPTIIDGVVRELGVINTTTQQASGLIPVMLKRYLNDPVYLGHIADAVAAKLKP